MGVSSKVVIIAKTGYHTLNNIYSLAMFVLKINHLICYAQSKRTHLNDLQESPRGREYSKHVNISKIKSKH